MSTIAKVLVAVAFALFLMALGYSVATSRASEDYHRLVRDVESLRTENAELADENRRLAAYKQALETDSRLIERRVRGHIGMVRRDELLILLNQP